LNSFLPKSRKLPLESRKSFSLSDALSRFSFTESEIAYVLYGLENINPGVGGGFLIEGLGMSSVGLDAGGIFRKLTPYQKLYVAVYTADKIAMSLTGIPEKENYDYLLVKEEFFYNNIISVRSVASKLAKLSSKDL